MVIVFKSNFVPIVLLTFKSYLAICDGFVSMQKEDVKELINEESFEPHVLGIPVFKFVRQTTEVEDVH